MSIVNDRVIIPTKMPETMNTITIKDKSSKKRIYTGSQTNHITHGCEELKINIIK